jgi:hypothetical protein
LESGTSSSFAARWLAARFGTRFWERRGGRGRQQRILELRERLSLLGAVILELEAVARQERSDLLRAERARSSSSRAEGTRRAARLREVEASLAATRARQDLAVWSRSALQRELAFLLQQDDAWSEVRTWIHHRHLRRRSAVMGFVAGVAVALNLTAMLWEPPAPATLVSVTPGDPTPFEPEPELDQADALVDAWYDEVAHAEGFDRLGSLFSPDTRSALSGAPLFSPDTRSAISGAPLFSPDTRSALSGAPLGLLEPPEDRIYVFQVSEAEAVILPRVRWDSATP